MKTIFFYFASLIIILAQFFTGCNYTSLKSENEKLVYVPFSEINITDEFWKPKIERNLEITVPHVLMMCEQNGFVNNFAIVAGLAQGEYKGLLNWDEMLYKAIEAASYSLMYHYDKTLDQKLDSIINIIALAQDEDGYIYSYAQYAESKGIWERSTRFTRKGSLELYHCSHLIEAAVAHYMATGKITLLEVAVRYTDLINRVFGPDGKKDVMGHANIELALPRLYKVTKDEKYLELSKFFINMRGNPDRPQLYGKFHQDHMPFIEQTEAVGQAPRATYLYSGAADVSYYQVIPEYDNALKTIWNDVVYRKMYITGGIGSHHENEGFGEPYYLPNLTAYSEVCAAISFSMWNTRMFKLHQDGKFFDILERSYYNNLLAGVSMSGDSYFYACPLESDGKFKFNMGWKPKDYADKYSDPSATRKEWFPCACCPPNYARYLFQISGFIYAHKGDELYVNLFIGSNTSVPVGKQQVIISQKTQYPWEGKVNIQIVPESNNSTFTLKLRIPSWASGRVVPGDLYHFADTLKANNILKLNGKAIECPVEKGYVSLNRNWSKGDVVELDLPMMVRLVESKHKLYENIGKYALQRGPLVYCVEAVDNGNSLAGVYADAETSIAVESWDEHFDGFVRVEMHNKSTTFSAIPYYLWSNRGENEMVVWIDKR